MTHPAVRTELVDHEVVKAALSAPNPHTLPPSIFFDSDVAPLVFDSVGIAVVQLGSNGQHVERIRAESLETDWNEADATDSSGDSLVYSGALSSGALSSGALSEDSATIMDSMLTGITFGQGGPHMTLSGDYQTDGDLVEADGSSGYAPSLEELRGRGIYAPSLEELRRRGADAEDTLARLRVWVDRGKASGTLATQVAELEDKHFRAIVAFVCGSTAAAATPGAPGVRRRVSKLIPSLRRPASSKALPRPGPPLVGTPCAFANVPCRKPPVPSKVDAVADDSIEDRRYIIQALSGVNTWAVVTAGVDQSAVSRTLARKAVSAA